MTNRSLADLSEQRLGFWSRGNGPTQEVFRIGLTEALLHLKALYLMTDRVLAAASFYFESEISRGAFSTLQTLFADGEVLFFIDASLEGFEEHGLRKREKSPSNFLAYVDRPLVAERGARLDRNAALLWRPDVNTSDRIALLWREDITSEEGSSIGAMISRIAPTLKARSTLKQALIDCAVHRHGDLVWPQMLPTLLGAGVPRPILSVARRRLAQMYATATAEVLGARGDSPALAMPSAALSRMDWDDTGLLIEVMRAARVGRALIQIDQHELRSLKASAEWVHFRRLYRALVEQASVDYSEVLEAIGVVDGMELSARGGATRAQFLQVFAGIGSSGAKHPGRFDRAVDVLRSAYEMFPNGLLDALSQRVEEIKHEASDTAPIRMRNRKDEELNGGLRSFIVHGHDETRLWALKDFLQNVLEWPEPIVLMQQPNRGRTIIEKFEELGAEVDIAFVLMTPDDAGGDDELFRMRQNVLFELGYFVGRFGRKSGRTVLLHGGSLELPTDLSGVAYIDVSGGIESAGEELRREVAGLSRRRRDA